MSTPRKNFNYNSPYAQPVQQYPSQSEDYISLDMGGLTPSNYNAKQSNFNEKTPAHYSGGKFYQQNYRNSNNKANRRNLFNNNYSSQNNSRQQNYNQQQPRYTPQHSYRKSNDGGGGQHQKQNQQSNRLSDRANAASYVHPSMTEDPWLELMQRMQSLKNSEINLKTKSPKQTTPPLPESSSHTDSDNSKDEEVQESD